MDVLMPQLGETVAEGRITQWFKSAGDTINPGDNLFEIETDKASMEVPSTTAGVLTEVRVPAGTVAPVGAVVAVIADTRGAHQDAEPRSPAAAQSSPPPLQRATSDAASAATFPASTSAGDIRLDPFFEVRTPARNYGRARLPSGAAVTPLARRLAGEAGIDLSAVRGTGPHGRIVARDVEAARPIAPGAAAPPATSTAPSTKQIKALYRDVPFQEVQLDGMRGTIAKRLVEAKQTIPHFYLSADLAPAALLDLREAANAAAPSQSNGSPAFRLSVNDLIIKAWATALVQVPEANAVWAQDRILRFERVDIGVAVAVDGGLLVPVIRGVEKKTLSAVAQEMEDLVSRARARKLEPDEYQGGASAISNLGMYGVREFCAIINPPQSSILAVGASRRAPVEKADGGIAFAPVMSVTLSCDHRVIDGALGARLLAAFKRTVEQPVAMLV